jgi:hypothetical protein
VPIPARIRALHSLLFLLFLPEFLLFLVEFVWMKEIKFQNRCLHFVRNKNLKTYFIHVTSCLLNFVRTHYIFLRILDLF